MTPELELAAKLLSGGGVLAFAAAVFLELRSDRAARREADKARLEADGRIATAVATMSQVVVRLEQTTSSISGQLERIDERTAIMLGEVTPVTPIESPRAQRRGAYGPRRGTRDDDG